jgi:hypothetical protein
VLGPFGAVICGDGLYLQPDRISAGRKIKMRTVPSGGAADQGVNHRRPKQLAGMVLIAPAPLPMPVLEPCAPARFNHMALVKECCRLLPCLVARDCPANYGSR